MITVKVEFKSSIPESGHIRTILCESQRSTKRDVNPLTTTDFNSLLDKIAQDAFDEGRRYERENPGKGNKS